MDPATRIDKAGATLAAFPVWTVTVTSAAGGATFSASNVAHAGVPARLVSLGDILRVARDRSRGSVTATLEGVTPEGSTAWWEAFAGADPLEGASFVVTVDDGTVAGTVFQGFVDEVQRLDGARAVLQAREGPCWSDDPVLVPITAEDWPDAPSGSLARFQPLVFGALDDHVPILVDDDRLTVVESALTSTADRVLVADTEGWPSSGTLRIDDEEMTFAGKTATRFTGLVRGVNGTTAGSHAPGAQVLEVGPLVYLVARHGLWGAGAVTNLRVQAASGELLPLPAGVTPTVDPTAPATITLSKQPELVASVATPPGLAFVDLDTVAFSSLSNAQAELALGLADGFVDNGSAQLTGTQGTGGQRQAAVELPPGGVVSRAWVVVEAFGTHELETALTAPVDAVATTLAVTSTAGWPSSGTLWLESGAQGAELVSYAGTTATTFTGVARGLNSDHQAAVSHPAGARVSASSGRVHLDLAGGNADQQNAIGDLQVKPTTPEEAACEIVPGAHGFEASHGHTISGHTHDWDSVHAHAAPLSPLRIDGFAVATKLGQGGQFGDPVAQGLVGFDTVPEMIKPDVAGAHDITHTNVPVITGGYDRANWYAILFPSEPFEGDERKVVGADFYCSISYTGTGNVQAVENGIPAGIVNQLTPPEVYGVIPIAVPPDKLDELPNAGGEIALQGNHGDFRLDTAIDATTPADGASLIVRDVSAEDVFDVWGRDAGPANDDSLPFPQEGYFLLENAGGLQEWVRYSGVVWTDTPGQRFRVDNIQRAQFGTSKITATAAFVERWPARHSMHRLFWNQAGTGQGGLGGADVGTTVAQMVANPEQPFVLQTRLGQTFSRIASSHDPTPWERTVEQIMFNGVAIVSGGSLIPFDETTTNIDEQYDSDLVVPRAPILWIRCHTNLQVHACWLELVLEDQTSEDPATPSGLPVEDEAPDQIEPLGTSTLTWFDVSDQVGSAADLEGATVKVVRQTGYGPDTLRVLRMFHVLEVQGATTTSREYPKVLVCDVEGAGIASQGQTCDGATAIEQVAVAALGLTAGDVLDTSSFTTVGALTYQDVAGAVVDQVEAAELIDDLGRQFRITPRWGLDGKLGVAYRPARDSLGSPALALTVEDVARSSLTAQRLPRQQAINAVTVRAGQDQLADGAPKLTASSETGDADLPLEVDAPYLVSQADADDLAAHVIDYNADVPDRVSLRGFVNLLTVLPGDIDSLTHPDRSSSGLLVERVRLAPSNGVAGFVTIEARDLTPPA